jgi:hypothetical protein
MAKCNYCHSNDIEVRTHGFIKDMCICDNCHRSFDALTLKAKFMILVAVVSAILFNLWLLHYLHERFG